MLPLCTFHNHWCMPTQAHLIWIDNFLLYTSNLCHNTKPIQILSLINLTDCEINMWNSLDFLKFVGPRGQKITRPAILPSMPIRVADKNFCFCILFCTGNRKCNWYAGTITVNSELDSASNDIYFLNMQLFPW